MNDIAIIGGGIAGLSVAARLAPQTSVILLEAEDQFGYHASGRSAAVFIEKYGNEAFIELRKVVLQSIVPDAQVEGMIKGNNNGGMTDDIGGMIGSSQPVAVSQDEYIIPADVVSMLGDGSSDSGAKKLDKFLDRVRIDKTGTTKQADKINKNVFPA